MQLSVTRPGGAEGLTQTFSFADPSGTYIDLNTFFAVTLTDAMSGSPGPGTLHTHPTTKARRLSRGVQFNAGDRASVPGDHPLRLAGLQVASLKAAL